MINHLYPPAQVQFEVGFSPNKFHYRSPFFDVDRNTSEEQEFVILPDFVIGTHFRVNILGAPATQAQDNKHYVALRYVGASGSQISMATEG